MAFQQKLQKLFLFTLVILFFTSDSWKKNKHKESTSRLLILTWDLVILDMNESQCQDELQNSFVAKDSKFHFHNKKRDNIFRKHTKNDRCDFARNDAEPKRTSLSREKNTGDFPCLNLHKSEWKRPWDEKHIKWAGEKHNTLNDTLWCFTMFLL